MKIYMTKKIIFICIFFFPLILNSQVKNTHGILIDDWKASEEKRSLNEGEFNRINHVIPRSNNVGIRDNRDTLIINNKKYMMINSPIEVLDKSRYLLYDYDEIRLGTVLGPIKRYVLDFGIINDSLYITRFRLSSNFKSDKKDEDVVKGIEYFWDKKIKDGVLKVDWLKLDDSFPIIQLYVFDCSDNVYSLEFKDGKFIKMEQKEGVKIERVGIPTLDELKESIEGVKPERVGIPSFDRLGNPI